MRLESEKISDLNEKRRQSAATCNAVLLKQLVVKSFCYVSFRVAERTSCAKDPRLARIVEKITLHTVSRQIVLISWTRSYGLAKSESVRLLEHFTGKIPLHNKLNHGRRTRQIPTSESQLRTSQSTATQPRLLADRARIHHDHLAQSKRSPATPHKFLPKLFGPLRERYAARPGGYTRVLRIEPEKEDQAASAILELVDGPKDMRFAMTAKTIASVRAKGLPINDMTAANIMKVTKFRQNADEELEAMVRQFEKMERIGEQGVEEVKKKRVYPDLPTTR
nr:54s ribosomal protein l8, mitochondrial [Quercus suber]